MELDGGGGGARAGLWGSHPMAMAMPPPNMAKLPAQLFSGFQGRGLPLPRRLQAKEGGHRAGWVCAGPTRARCRQAGVPSKPHPCARALLAGGSAQQATPAPRWQHLPGPDGP